LNIFFFLLISLAIAFLFFGQSFSVSAASTNATGGYVTYLNLNVQQQTSHWTGFFGEFVFAPQSQAPTSVTAGGGNLTLQNFIFTTSCAGPTNISGVIMFTNSSSLPTGLVPGNLTMLNNSVPGVLDSPSNTFTQLSSYVIGGNTINNVPTTYTYINSSPQNTSFKEGYLQDSNGNLVFVSVIEENILGFNQSTYDFQIMTPVLNFGPTSYNVFADFTYNCPAVGGVVFECSDGLDNDNDGYIDYPNDNDCDSATDNTESGGAKQQRGDGRGTPGYDPTYTSYKGLLGRWLEEEKEEEPEPAKPAKAAKPGKPGAPAKPAKPAVYPKVGIKPVEEGLPRIFPLNLWLAMFLRALLFIIVFSFAQKDIINYKKLMKSLK
jgi:hypothetical protein